MAGTLTFDIAPLHIYQRKFSSQDLDEALRFSHIYIISRRPKTRIDYIFAGNNFVFVHFSGLLQVDGESFGRRSTLKFPEARILAAQTFESGEYFSVTTENETIHGDSWSLLSCVTHAQPSLSWHEVLYVGRAFGTDGERNVSHRVRKHDTLQHIYEDHSGTDWDIFVTPIEIKRNHYLPVDHIDDAESGVNPISYAKVFAQPSPVVAGRSKLSRESVELVEHSLISAYRPSYNDQLLKWNVKQPTKAMRLAKRLRFRLVAVVFEDLQGVARYVSNALPLGKRANYFTFPLTGHDHPGPTGRLPEDAGFGLPARSQRLYELMATNNDRAQGEFSIFGPEAPDIRRPPQV